MKKVHFSTGFCGILIFCLVGQVFALATNPADINIDFRFNNPGARANAMGGAFIAVADDATAAYTNPAGLTILTKPEASFEFKSTNTEQSIPWLDLGTLTHSATQELNSSVNGSSFMSYAKPQDKITFSFFRHELLNIAQTVDDERQYVRGENVLDSELDINVITYGVGGGMKLGNDLSVGFSVGFSLLDYYYNVVATDVNTGGVSTWSSVNSSDSSEQYTASILYNPENFAIGLIYRQGPEFNTSYTDHKYDNGGADLESREMKNYLNVPDAYGIGVSYRFFNSLTVAADLVRVKYSDLLDEHYYWDGNEYPNDQWVKTTTEFEINDTTEVHLGFEYVFVYQETPMALRGGYFHRPDHTLHWTGPTSGPTVIGLETYRDRFVEGPDDNIYSIGLGAVLDANIQLDLAVSIGDLVAEYIFSTVYRF